ncbi:MAG: PASTA domain-containing protein [Vulcanimicrobiaceae bacterium]
MWFGHAIVDFVLPPANTVTVPSFVGQTQGDADAEVRRLKLTARVIDRTISDRYPKGVVINQRPDAGAQVRPGRQMSFVVSDGVFSRLMPDLRYQSLREVGLDLSRSHLQLGKTTYEKSTVIPQGHVIAQDPEPLANVVEGDTVNLVVSKGGASSLPVPDFIGMPIDGARALAKKDGLQLGQLVWTPLGVHGPPHGTVARQTPAAGSKIAPFQPVSLQVSAGPNESGYIIRQVHVLASIPVPENLVAGESVKVRLMVRDATGSYDAYRAYAQPGQKLDFTVTAVGTSVVDLFVNDVLVGESRLGTEPAVIYNQKPRPSHSSGGP